MVDDHALLREGLVGLLRECQQFEQVEQASTYDEAVERAGKIRPDVILADAWLDQSNGSPTSLLSLGQWWLTRKLSFCPLMPQMSC